MRRLLALARRTETRALLIWVCGLGAAWAFLNVADEVSEGETSALDRHLLLMLRRPGALDDPIGPRWLEKSLRDVTALGGFTVLTLLTLLWVLAFTLYGHRRQAWIMGATMVLAQVSSETLKALYDRPRPALVPHGSIVYSQSFPSGHSALSAAAFLTLATLIASLAPRRAIKVMTFAVASLLVVAVGFSRIYLGVHWPTDVLAGWCLGSAWAFVAWVALSLLRRQDAGAKPSVA